MGKYGPGVGVMDAQRMEVSEVRRILDRYNMEEEDRQAIMDALLESNYQWSQANASACYLEQVLKKEMGEKKYLKFIGRHMIGYSTFAMKKFEESFYNPNEDEDVQEEL